MSLAIPYPRTRTVSSLPLPWIALLAGAGVVAGLGVVASGGDPTIFAVLALIPIAGATVATRKAGSRRSLASADS